MKINDVDLHDYANHFSALISRMRLGLSIDEPILLPDAYFRAKYPERYQNISYDTHKIQALKKIVDWFNSQLKKTKDIIKSLFEDIGELIYGNKTHFNEALQEVL